MKSEEVERNLKGKFLVRRSTTAGKPCLIIAGVFFPEFDINSIETSDEMWVAEITVHSGGIRFYDNNEKSAGYSIEEFLEGRNMSSQDWNKKETL